jgi:trimeric autotransporter adhesin
MRRILVLACLAASGPCAAVSNVFTYQGSLLDAGVPAQGSYDLQFQLLSGGVPSAPLARDDVAVQGGVFTVELDFGTAITGADYELVIGVRPGTATTPYTVLSPATRIRPTPQAQVAGLSTV